MKIDSIIPVAASTPWGYKMSAFNSFIKRAHIVCSDEFLEDELNYIVKIGMDHGYNTQVIHKLIEKFNRYHQSAQLTRPIYRKISYIPAMFERLTPYMPRKTYEIHSPVPQLELSGLTK